MDTNLGDALSGLVLLLSSDSNNDSDDGSTTHIAFYGFSILFVCYAHAPSSQPLTSWLSLSSRSLSLVPAALGTLPPLAIRCPWQSATIGNLPPLAIRRRRDTSSPRLISPRHTSRQSQSHRTIDQRSRLLDNSGTALAAGIWSPIAFIGPQDVVPPPPPLRCHPPQWQQQRRQRRRCICLAFQIVARPTPMPKPTPMQR
jgi:hypothetical protein